MINKIEMIVHRYSSVVSVLLAFVLTLIATLKFQNKYAILLQGSVLLSSLLFVLLTFLINKVLTSLDLKKEWLIIIPSAIFSSAISIGMYFFDESDGFVNAILLIVYLTAILFVLLALIFRFLDKYKGYSYFTFNKKYFWYLWLFIFMTWIPAFLAMYPGNLSYDGVPQLLQTIGNQGLSAHHPLLHTLYLTYSFELGKNLFNSYDIGLAFYSLTQMALLSASLAYMVYQLIKNQVNKVFVIYAILFVSINPLIQIWALTTTKDVPFAALFVFSFVILYDLIKDSHTFFRSKQAILKLSISLILMCLLRNQGVYVIIFTSFFIIWAIHGKGNKLRFSINILAVLLIVKFVLGPFSTFIGVKKGDSREMYSVPMQQISRVYMLRRDAISSQQLDVIEKVIPTTYLSQYNPLVSDPVKSGFDTVAFNKNKKDFLKVWLNLGMHNKKLYLESFLYGSVGYFYPDNIPYWLWYIMYDGAHQQFSPVKIHRRPILKAYDNYLRNFSTRLNFQNIPVYNLIVNEAFPFLAMIFTLGYALYQRKYKKIAIVMLPFGFWGTLLLGPVIAVRYAFPIYVCIPFILGLVFINEKSEEKV